MRFHTGFAGGRLEIHPHKISAELNRVPLAWHWRRKLEVLRKLRKVQKWFLGYVWKE